LRAAFRGEELLTAEFTKKLKHNINYFQLVTSSRSAGQKRIYDLRTGGCYFSVNLFSYFARMKMFCCLWVFASFCLAGYSQDDTTGTFIQGYLLKSKADNIELYSLWYQSEIHDISAPDSALMYAQKGLLFARALKFSEGEALCLLSIAKIFATIGDYPRALQTALQSLEIFERINVPSEVAINLYIISGIFNLQGDFRQSLVYDLRAKSIAESIQDKKILIQIFANIGHDYEKLNLLDSALSYANKSYVLCDRYEDAFVIGKTASLIGDIYSRSGKLDQAMNFFHISISYCSKINDSLLHSGILKDNIAICDDYLGIADIFKKENRTDSCLYYATKSLAIAEQDRFTLQVLNASNFLTGYYKQRKMFDSAFAYQQLSIDAKDSLFSSQKIMQFQNISFSEQMRQQELKEAEVRYRNRISIYILFGAVASILIIAIILWRNNRLKQSANNLLNKQKQEIEFQKMKAENALEELQAAQAQLVQAEKMASLGELTAGIAHEIQNPLNFVNNFSEVNAELISELKGEHLKTRDQRDEKLENELLHDIAQNLEKIHQHGRRADAIVKGMLLHSRSSTGQKELTNINALADEYLRLSYHGIRAKDKSFNVTMHTDFDHGIGKINIIPQDMGRVILNLYNNAFYAVAEKNTKQSEGYEPIVSVSTKKINNKIELRVRDNGNGIPANVMDKIFQPFFTTKPSGQGTGLGLSLSYDIVRAHGGELKAETREGEYAEFIIQLPLNT
jgi:two-component system NtrC family sensor kinase